MSRCARCGHELGVGRFCTNCGHTIGEPVPESEVLPRLDDGPPPDQPGTGRPPWLPAVVALVLALVLAIVLVSCPGSDDEPPDAATHPATGAPVASAPAGTRA